MKVQTVQSYNSMAEGKPLTYPFCKSNGQYRLTGWIASGENCAYWGLTKKEAIKSFLKHQHTFDDIRDAIRTESISYGEIAELQSLAKYIDPNDTELRQWAGI